MAEFFEGVDDSSAEAIGELEERINELAEQVRITQEQMKELQQAVMSIIEREERGEQIYGVRKYGKKPSKGWGAGGFFYWGRFGVFSPMFISSLLMRRAALKGLRTIMKKYGIPTYLIGIVSMIVGMVIWFYLREERERQRYEMEERLNQERRAILNAVLEQLGERARELERYARSSEEVNEILRSVVPR